MDMFYISTFDDLLGAIEEYGIVPYFRNSLPGFSIEEHVAPHAWFSDDTEGVWEWKGPAIQASRCAYGKFFEKKAAFVRQDIFEDLANYRRDGYDYEGFFNDERGTYKDKALFDLIEAKGPILSRELKRLGNYKKGGNTGFDTSINRLQHQCFVVISDFKYMKDRYGKEYGWGVAEYATAERFMGEELSGIYSTDPKDSYEKVLDHFRGMFPDIGEEAIKRFLG